jgi:hypothetical protein
MRCLQPRKNFNDVTRGASDESHAIFDAIMGIAGDGAGRLFVGRLIAL